MYSQFSEKELKAIRKTTVWHFIDRHHGHLVFVKKTRSKGNNTPDALISCAYKYANCACSKNKKWFSNRSKFYSQHGLEH